MKKLLIGGGLIGILALIFILATPATDEPVPTPEAPPAKAPLITVTSGEVSVTKDGNTRTLGTPEEIQPPFTLTTKAGGSAVASFPDGSELRLDENSELLVNTATYGTGNGEINVHTKLSIGRVWSSIVALVTPASSWEVETSNVVATVRGTAFGVEAHPDKKTTVIGSEHTVELTLIDPETGKRDEKRKIGLAEDEVVVIGDDDARDATKDFPTRRKRTNEERDNPWIKKNEPATGGPRGTDALRDVEDELGEATAPADTPVDSVPSLISPRTPTVPAGTQTVRPVSLAITPSVPLPGIIEGTSVPITATVAYSDGTTREASNAVTWSVIGNVGSMRGYIFDPLLDASVSEFGRAYGSIRAVWKDPTTGVELEASTEIFEVKPKLIRLIEEG